jgi:anaerobic ribonucleoside-triphosphate reductase activating protein
MQIAHLHPQSEIYGPGTRFVIWTQGCSLGCAGCWNKAFWPFDRGEVMTTAALMAQIMAEGDAIEGVTILGGEPFDQASALLELAVAIKLKGLSLMIYSGYTKAELDAKGHAMILAHSDILVDGRYVHTLRNTGLRWRGSENQQVWILSDRYAAIQIEAQQEIEIVWEESGIQRTYGYPEAWVLDTN